MENTTTGDLFKSLKRTKSFDTYFERSKDAMNAPPIHQYLKGLLNRENPPMKAGHVIERAGVNLPFGYQVFRGTRKPSRDTTLSLAIGFGLNMEEAQQLLRAARHAALYPRIPRDAILIFAFEHKLSIDDVQQLLSDKGAGLLYGDNN
ncbi:MAG: hypothetical protein LBN97_01930 [Oscillospiraceae bacterium]|jgi:hypothetical protein|nr:hypothetical protein [Oscillospiraceae bacterium]